MSTDSKSSATSPNMDRLRAIRQGHRGVVTKATKEVDELLSEERTSRESFDCLNVFLQQLDNKMHVLRDIDQEILTLCLVEEIEREIEESETVVAKTLKYKHKIDTALRARHCRRSCGANGIL